MLNDMLYENFENMPEALVENVALNNKSLRRWGLFALKACAVLLLLRLFGNVAAEGAAAVGIVWALASTLSAMAVAYVAVVEKDLKRYRFQVGKLFARLNAGRVLAIVVAFVLGAAFSACLLLDLPQWGAAEWIAAVLTIPIFAIAFALCEKTIPSQYTPGLRVAATLKFAIPLATALLCVGYFAACYILPTAEFDTAADAFLAAQQAYANAPCALVEETGLLTSLVAGFTSFGVSQAAQTSPFWYGAANVFLCASSFFTIANMLGVCMLDRRELRRIVDPLGVDSNSVPPSATQQAVQTTKAGLPKAKRYIATACIMPIALIALFLGANSHAEQAVATGADTPIRQFVSSQIDLAVYVLDGKYYDEQKVNDLLAETREKAQALSAEAQESLVPLINAAFDQRVAKVDSYLDWYYSLPADYERLANLVGGNVEQYVADQLTTKIEEGIDESALASQLNVYLRQADDLREECYSQLDDCQIQGMPDWLIKTKDVLERAFVDDSLTPVDSLLTANERFAISGGAGIAAGVIAKKVVEKAMQKQFFGKVVSRITNVLGARAIGGTVGAAVGSPGGPVLSVAGALIGAAAGIGVDYAMLKVDETQNRETYKAQIIEAIEEERAETLALIQ